MGVNDLVWMKKAYALALEAEKSGEVPVGAVLISESNQLIGQGFNQTIIHNDPTAHAEICAIRAAAQHTQNYRLLNTTLYVTLEPCVMCAGALLEARITRLVFATRDLKAGATGSAHNLLRHIQIDEGVLQAECAHLLSHFFQNRREK
ncbi:MAG: tRNA adenosine(34) deaminase TadA [Gammaproteobacteria bacterium]|nr:tRNA adenosine(34) deaminase TadA [Gammaproteobacteria bacterium]